MAWVQGYRGRKRARFHEDDFRVRSKVVERYGQAAILADSSLVDWPLSYADLEPCYDRAEYELGVSGKAP